MTKHIVPGPGVWSIPGCTSPDTASSPGQRGITRGLGAALSGEAEPDAAATAPKLEPSGATRTHWPAVASSPVPAPPTVQPEEVSSASQVRAGFMSRSWGGSPGSILRSKTSGWYPARRASIR